VIINQGFQNPYPHSVVVKGTSAELQRICDTLKATAFPFRIIKEGMTLQIPGAPTTNEITQLTVQYTGKPEELKEFLLKNYKVALS